MDALGDIIISIFAFGIIFIIAIIVAVIWIIYKFLKNPKRSLRMFLSTVVSIFIVIPLAFFTKSWWFDLENKTEASIVGLMISLALVFIIIYALNRYFSKGDAKQIEQQKFENNRNQNF